jgi:hypothetical protein
MLRLVIPPLVPVSYWVAQSFEKSGDPVPILADKVDPSTGEIVDLLASHTPVDGLLIEAFRVEAESGPALDGAGHTLREVRHTDDSDLSEIDARTRSAVKHLVDLNLVSVTKVQVERTSFDGVECTAYVKDLTIQNDLNEARPFPVTRS